MKRLLIVALGLGLAGQTQAEKMNLTLESGSGLITAVAEFPDNLIEIQKKVTGKEKSLEATTYSLQNNVKTLTGYKVGGTYTKDKGTPNEREVKIKTKKESALLKIGTVFSILTDVIDFLQYSLDVNAIVKDRMILPVLNVAGQQSLLDPLNKMTANIDAFKLKLIDVKKQMKDIFDLVSLLVPMPEPVEEEPVVATGRRK